MYLLLSGAYFGKYLKTVDYATQQQHNNSCNITYSKTIFFLLAIGDMLNIITALPFYLLTKYWFVK